MIVPPSFGEHLLWTGGLWVALASLWAVICMWVDRDARKVFGQALPWNLIFAAVGVLLFVATWQAGLGPLVLFALLVPAFTLGYVALRDTKAKPTDKILSATFARRTGRKLAVRLGLERQFDRAFPAGASGGLTRTGPAPRIVLLKKDGTTVDGKGGGLDRETSQAVKTVQEMFLKAVDLRATDIHCEPKNNEEYVVRCRIDGILQNIVAFPADEGKAVISAMKVLGDMDIAEKRRPQDGTFTVLMEDRRFDVRAASAPTSFGEKMALRLLDADGGIVKGGLGAIGMKDSVVANLREIIQQPHGMLIVCGPTGSGKTTTLYSALSEIDVNSKNIITIEDPIEYRLEGISQTAVNVAAELTFAKILRSTLRQDPDVILIGEIRDKETAEIAMQAAMTGHFVFTTLHANDAPTTITRLLDIGVEATLIQSAVSAVLAQRLVRVLCPKCKQAVQLSDEIKQKWGIAAGKDVTVYQEKGCPACHGTGFRGRTGLHELMIFDNSIRELLIGRPSMQTIRQAARKGGMKTLLEAGVGKVLAGITSVSEMQRVAK